MEEREREGEKEGDVRGSKANKNRPFKYSLLHLKGPLYPSRIAHCLSRAQEWVSDSSSRCY